MHGNAGNKMEGLEYAEMLLPMGITLFTFDFSGCGNSEGEWVTLGWKEVHDLEMVVEYLQGLGTVSKIALWGRSMGAATSLLYSGNHELASCLILDSAFTTLNSTVSYLGQQMGVPPQLFDILFFGIKV